MVTVKPSLDNETAKIFEKALQADRKKVHLPLSLWLREFDTPSVTLDQLMDEISRKAQDRGLTPKILESILHD